MARLRRYGIGTITTRQSGSVLHIELKFPVADTLFALVFGLVSAAGCTVSAMAARGLGTRVVMVLLVVVCIAMVWFASAYLRYRTQITLDRTRLRIRLSRFARRDVCREFAATDVVQVYNVSCETAYDRWYKRHGARRTLRFFGFERAPLEPIHLLKMLMADGSRLTLLPAMLSQADAMKVEQLIEQFLAIQNHTAVCPKCGYDMRASPERCSECGWTSVLYYQRNLAQATVELSEQLGQTEK